jgi:hypothetical protein
MSKRLERILRDALDARLDGVEQRIEDLSATLASIEHGQRLLEDSLQSHRESMRQLGEALEQVRNIVGAQFDRIPELRAALLTARADNDYAAAFDEAEPRITVRLATYDRGEILFDRTIPSIQSQTYANFECIVVSDRCTDDTRVRIEGLGDPRFRFVELQGRGEYPSDPHHRWMVAGAPAMNLGAQLAEGRWIAPIDDDDEFTPDHLEVLLREAQAGRFELVYGNFRWERGGGPEIVGHFPPEHSHFGMQAAMYMAKLWVLEEPSDWNLCRRMMEAGVRMGYVDHVVTVIYPTGPRDDPSAAAEPS